MADHEAAQDQGFLTVPGADTYGAHTQTPASPPAATTDTPATTSADVSMTRSEEHLRVDVEREATAIARLVKYSITEEQTFTVPVTREDVRIVWGPPTAKPANGDVRGNDEQPAGPVTLYAEQVVVTKRWVPVELARLEVTTVTEHQTVTDTVRTEHIDVDTRRLPRHG